MGFYAFSNDEGAHDCAQKCRGRSCACPERGTNEKTKQWYHAYSRAPVRCLTYNGWKSHLVRSSQPLVSSLGAEVVTLGLSVGKKAIEP